jgi:ankyrin repeat protein
MINFQSPWDRLKILLLVLLFLVPLWLAIVLGSNTMWSFVNMGAHRVVNLLLIFGINPNQCNVECPVNLAALHGDLKMLQIFDRNGADLKIHNQFHQNAMNLACANVEVLRFLFERGVDINNQSIDEKGQPGFSVLHCAVFNNKPEAVKFLLENGADRNVKMSSWAGQKDVTPLQLAQIKGYADLVALF